MSTTAHALTGGGGASATISLDHFIQSLWQYYLGLCQEGAGRQTPTGCAISPQEVEGLINPEHCSAGEGGREGRTDRWRERRKEGEKKGGRREFSSRKGKEKRRNREKERGREDVEKKEKGREGGERKGMRGNVSLFSCIQVACVLVQSTYYMYVSTYGAPPLPLPSSPPPGRGSEGGDV